MKLPPVIEKIVLHWGEMGARWGVNRSVAQIHALLWLPGRPMNAEEIAETRDALVRRLENAAGEIRACFEADYVVINDRVDDALDELASIVVAARAARARRRQLAEQIVATFPDPGQDDTGA